MIKKLLNTHQDLLDIKNIRTEIDLAQIIQFDLEKIIWAIYELQNRTTSNLLTDIFEKNRKILPQLSEKGYNDSIHHIGFEIYEPFDLALSIFEQKFDDIRTKICNIDRFPASLEFQKRANAYVEIMRIELEINKQELLLELFDFHRPVDLPRLGTRLSNDIPDFENLSMTNKVSVESSDLMADDKIWHYAVHIDHTEQVSELHEYFKTLAQNNSTYILPFSTIVHNKNDGSFYTKIINCEKKLELECVTEIN